MSVLQKPKRAAFCKMINNFWLSKIFRLPAYCGSIPIFFDGLWSCGYRFHLDCWWKAHRAEWKTSVHRPDSPATYLLALGLYFVLIGLFALVFFGYRLAVDRLCRPLSISLGIVADNTQWYCHPYMAWSAGDGSCPLTDVASSLPRPYPLALSPVQALWGDGHYIMHADIMCIGSRASSGHGITRLWHGVKCRLHR